MIEQLEVIVIGSVLTFKLRMCLFKLPLAMLYVISESAIVANKRNNKEANQTKYTSLFTYIQR